MIVAQEKRKENICEYLLYMWQVEDLIRAAGCDPQSIEELILSRYQVDEAQRAEILNWYLELAAMMRREGKQEVGHLDVNRVVLLELEALHRRLLANPNDYVYAGLHYQVLPAVIQLRTKSLGVEAGDVESCFNAIYGYLTLALKGETVGEETKKSIQQMSAFLSMLAHRYKLEREQTII